MTDAKNLPEPLPISVEDERELCARRVARQFLAEQASLRESALEQWEPAVWQELITALLTRQIELMDELQVAHEVGRDMFKELKRKDEEPTSRIKGRADVIARQNVRDFTAEEHEGYDSHLQVFRDIRLKDGPSQKYSDEKVLEWVRTEWKKQGRKVTAGRPRKKGVD
ncbi:hypothetical protein NMQ14_03310 [Methyloversatilis sp. XJ19-13]|uniref:hypothetical protein n=1 Tax=Methyloversatilis sp. XJ19-13 TaxID=2963430 RepID=UPI00211B9770|nr:hypothetical protein [Methyloversatilis sp. XJ19-13]MCQ9373273.1 hypothetical protein [Methyloversatilis sp. XJ19-13]